jgi:DNA replication protein DnaC
MLDSATIDGLKALRLDAMAAALAEQREQASYTGLGSDERLGLLVDRELTARASRRMDRCLKAARLRSPAAVEDIDFRHPRGLDRAQILGLAQAHWASNRRAIVITGPTGSGKTYLACALAHAAIRTGHTALYQRGPRMLDELAIARGDGRLARLLATWARVSVLVIDDLLIRPANAIMTAVDQAGNKVARYRYIAKSGQQIKHSSWGPAEIIVHPSQKLTDELTLALTLSANWFGQYFSSPSG